VERLWTPWRMSYVAGAPKSDCLFCDAAADSHDEENLILYRGDRALVMLNLYPYNTGHLMVAPLSHGADLARLRPDESAEMWRLTQLAVAALGQEYRPDGFNVGMNLGRVAGAGVPDHLHLHVVPRWNGDTNFMPITADTKVLPEGLGDTYRRLRARFQPSGSK
jgi:ATP adenylyltransferase